MTPPEEMPPEENIPSSYSNVSEAVLTEAAHHADVVHTSLLGMTAIVMMLLLAVALPVLGYEPVRNVAAFAVMVFAAAIGIGGMYLINYRVHKHVTNQARLTEVLVNSLGQGFLVFDSKGRCGNVYSQACLDLLETVPAGKNITTVLRIPNEKKRELQDWIDILFQSDHALSFEDAVKFLPQFFPHSQGRRVSLVYRPIRRRSGEIDKVVVIATDQTEEYSARQAAKRQQAYAEMICRIFKERNKYHNTIAQIRDFLEAATTPALGLKDSHGLLRQLHTLKATVSYFNLFDLSEAIHAVENDLRSPLVDDDAKFFRALQAGRQKIADVFLKTTDEIRDLVGGEQEWKGNIREIEESELYAFAQEMIKQRVPMPLVQHYFSTIAAVPIRDCFRSFERELKELASVLDKQIKPIRFLGDNPRVLTQPIQDFLYSLTHISRNIMDHGIEAAVTRMARNKDPAGEVVIKTEIISKNDEEKWLHIVISDDGNGIDPSRIRAKLSALDPEGGWRFEDDHAVIQRIFSWGFSTNSDVSNISGRGVGLEAVEREVKLLGGSISVSSELYKGAAFDILIPYNMDVNQIMSIPDGKNAA